MKHLSILQKTIRLVVAAGVLNIAANAATVFDFENIATGTSTAFTDTVNGLSATFTSGADPGGFVVYPSIFETLTGNVLGDPGPAGADGLVLDIAFSRDQSAVTFDFATTDLSTPSPLTVTAYENSKLVGSASSTGQFLNGFAFPEGEIAFAGGNFNSLVISSTATDFAVDNITVASDAPEPAASALYAIGLLALAPWLRQRSRRRTAKP